MVKGKSSGKNKVKETKRNYDALILVVIVVITVIIYSNAFTNGILNFDDNEYFEKYPEILSLSWTSIVKYFSNYYVLMYQPIPVLSFAVNYFLTKLSAFPIHSVNILFHLFNVIFVYYLFYKISGKYEVATIVSFLFAIHPMNVEAVSWLSARSSSMYAFFFILSIIFYVKYIKVANQTGIKNLLNLNYLLSFGFFILSLFSKSQAVTLPLVLILLDFYYQRFEFNFSKVSNFGKVVILEKVPYFLLSLVFGYITLSEKITTDIVKDTILQSYNFIDSFFLICYSFLFYFYKLILPFNLCAVHVYPPKVNGYLPLVYYLSPVLLIVLALLLFRFSQKRKYIILGVGFFIFTILLNIPFVHSRINLVSERYAYIPYLGLFYIIGEVFFEIRKHKIILKKSLIQMLYFLLIIFVVCFVVISFNRNTVWKDNISLMTDIINKNPPVPYISKAYLRRANAYIKVDSTKSAINDFTNAIIIDPKNETPFYSRSLLYMNLKQYQEAINDMDKCITLNPGIAIIYCNRAYAKYNIKDYKGAMDDCDKAIVLKPDKGEVYLTRAMLKIYFNDFTGAENDFNKAIALDSGNSEAYIGRGNLYLKLNQIEKACKDFTTASQMGNQEANQLLQEHCNSIN